MGIIKLKNSQEKVEKVEEQMQEMSVVDTEDVKQWDDAAILREDETRTDEYSRHYVLNNGTAKTVVSAEAVNYYDDEEQKWKQIDNTLVEKEDVFESKRGKVKTEISKVKKGRKVKISKGEKAVAWEFVGKKSFIETLAVNDKKTELKVKACDNLNQMESKAVYENVEKGTDLEYVLKGNNLKENIVVREKSADYRYLFALKT